ncbi:hypothetical protein, partial [Burkholderia multivorans]|uniref:hypothetical protein n=2 Tax=Burkholderia multivorans TaxID=87883 RepID=UPI00286FFE60
VKPGGSRGIEIGMACRLANSRLTVENRVWAKIMRCAKHVGENGVEKPWCIRANGESTTAGASGCSDRFNRQLNQDEKKAIRDKANGDKNEEQRLTRAACYAVKCWAEYAAGSDERNKNFVSEVEAASLAKELDWVNQQKGSGLFEYTALQKGGALL